MQSQVVNVCPQYQSTYKCLLAFNTCGNWLPNSAAAMRRLAVPTKGSRTRLPPETWNSFRTLDPSYFALPELGWPSANWALDPWGKKVLIRFKFESLTWLCFQWTSSFWWRVSWCSPFFHLQSERWFNIDFQNWSIPCDPEESVQGFRVLCFGPAPRTPGNKGSRLGC